MSNEHGYIKTTIAEELKRGRLSKKYSQRQLAQKMGVDKTTISSWERDVRFPKEQHLLFIADLLGISDLYLLSVSKNRKKIAQLQHESN